MSDLGLTAGNENLIKPAVPTSCRIPYVFSFKSLAKVNSIKHTRQQLAGMAVLVKEK